MFLAVFVCFPDAFLFLDTSSSLAGNVSFEALLSRTACLIPTVSYLSAGSPTTAHRNLTSNSLSDFSDKPEKDQVMFLHLSILVDRDD